MKQHFLGWFCRWLNNRGILTHPTPGAAIPCRTVTEHCDSWRITPRRLVIWRVRRTLSIVYPVRFPRMVLMSATSYTHKRGLRWQVIYTLGCEVPK